MPDTRYTSYTDSEDGSGKIRFSRAACGFDTQFGISDSMLVIYYEEKMCEITRETYTHRQEKGSANFGFNSVIY